MKNSTLKDIIYVAFSSTISLLSSILNGFVIPVVLGTLNYGYYKIFALYASYTALCHFGFNDGILLVHGGEQYNTLNKYDFRSNSFFFLLLQLIVSSCIIIMYFFTNNSFYKILYLLLGINSFTQNILGYYQNISQTTLRFNEFSVIDIIHSMILIVSVLLLLGYCKLFQIHNLSFVPYVFIMIGANILLILWYLYDYRDITFGVRTSLSKRIKSLKKYFISGFYLTFGYGISVLLFNLDSQFVVKFFSVRTYGIYGFAYSMISAGLTILGSSAVVLLPHLKTHTEKYILSKYSNSITYVALLVGLAITGYFPLEIIVNKFLSEYSDSLIYFRILLPGLIITCCISIVVANYYYALKKEKFYFYLSLIVLVISFFVDLLNYVVFRSTIALAFSSIISLVIWYLISNYFIVKWYHVKWIKNCIYIFLIMCVFLIISSCTSIIIGSFSYLVLYIIISLILFRKLCIKMLIKLWTKIF